MQRCELAAECCVCSIPFCPYEDRDFDADEWDDENEYEDEGW